MRLTLQMKVFAIVGMATTMIAVLGIKGAVNQSHVADQLAATQRALDELHPEERAHLALAFAPIRELQAAATREREIISILGVTLLLGVSIAIGRNLGRRLRTLEVGFERYGRNELATPIVLDGDDELVDVATEANAMAARQRQLAIERERSTWVARGLAGLDEVLRGEFEPAALAQRIVTYLASYVNAPVAALYFGPVDGPYQQIAGHAVPDRLAPRTFAKGEGLVGQAATTTKVTVIEGGAAASDHGFALRSGLVDAVAHTLVLLPIARDRAVTGVIELALAHAWSLQGGELLALAQTPIATTLEVSRGRAAALALLAETRRQASELEATHASLEQKASELARANAHKSQFLASMSHELRTPLNAIIGFSELMYDGVLPLDSGQAKEYLGDILTSGRHLLQLINDVLDLSKVEAGRLEFHPEPIQLGKVTTEVIGILRTVAAKRGVRIEVVLDPAVEQLFLDPARLKQVLYNYLSNALKFTAERGRVILRAQPEGEAQVRLSVQDTGSGISVTDQQRLFGEFQQTRAGARQEGGTGLGLALTKRLVEAQGGTVGVTSTVGEGSTFYAVLPRKGRRHDSPLHGSPPIVVRTGAPTVLVIEDEPEERSHLAAMLAKAGYAVDSVGTGAQALARCSQQVYSAITLDLFLPDMTGLEVLQRIRKGRNVEVPVIVISVVAEPGAVAGLVIHDVMAKPLDDRALLASLIRANVRPHDATAVVLVVDDDPASLKVMGATLQQLGYSAVCELDPVQALRAAIEEPPAAIVLDLVMPGLSGFQFLDELRNHATTRSTPVIVWTSKDLDGEELLRLRASAHAVVSKGHDGNARVLAELALFVPAHPEKAS